MRFLTMFENAKEFTERNRIFSKFKFQDQRYTELKDEYLTFPENSEQKVCLKIAFPYSKSPNEPKRVAFIFH